MLYHYLPATTGGSPVRQLAGRISAISWTGVDLFFVLSGFLITGILLDSRGASNYFSSFYMRRILRIMPLYYVSLVVIFWFLPHSVTGINASSHQLWYFFYVQNWTGWFFPIVGWPGVGHFWSLGVEEQFYLLWPLVVYRFAPKRVLQIAIALSLISVGLRFVLISHTHPENIYRNTLTRMDSLLIGAVCASLVRWKPISSELHRYQHLLALAPLAIIPWLALARMPTQLAPAVQGVGFSLLALAYGCLLLSLVESAGTCGLPHRLQMIFSAGILRMFGRYSYAAYVWHPLVKGLIATYVFKPFALRPPGVVEVPLLIGATLLISAGSYVVIERPFLSLKCYFVAK
jgi:peptidoglycan/LPS O-acetylase OafA/YrhL